MTVAKVLKSNAKPICFVIRIVISSHFVFEWIDKIVRFHHWVKVISESGMPLPTAELILVIILLTIGCISIITGKYMLIGVCSLILFQLPTTILFESTSYEQFQSISIIGSLMYLAFVQWLIENTNSNIMITHEKRLQTNQKAEIYGILDSSNE